MGARASSRAAWGTSRGASLTHIWTGTHRDQTLCPVSNRAALCLLPRLRQFLGLGVQIEALMGMEVNKTDRQGGRSSRRGSAGAPQQRWLVWPLFWARRG